MPLYSPASHIIICDGETAYFGSQNPWLCQRVRDVADVGAGPSAADQQLELEEKMFERSEGFEARRPKQIEVPPFPTTTIGSFPQTNGEIIHISTARLYLVSVGCFCHPDRGPL